MYRQFKNVNEVVLEELNQFIKETSEVSVVSTARRNSSITGAISMALTYTYRMSILDQSIQTTTASAINTSAINSKQSDASSSTTTAGISPSTSTSIKSRILIVSANDGDDSINYIPLMNCIFTAQKLKVSIDVAKLGFKNSSYLQQASDATNGIYLHIEDPQGIIQVLTTAFLLNPIYDPMLFYLQILKSIIKLVVLLQSDLWMWGLFVQFVYV